MAKKVLKSKNIFIEKNNIIDGFVVIEGNRIYDVQPAEAIDKYADCEIIDYGDQTIMPAFHDSHTHLILAAMVEKGGDLRYTKTEEEAAKQFYDRNKDSKDKWLLGGGWDPYNWTEPHYPNRKTLDKYFPDRLVMLFNREIHGAWVNTKTLEYFGIDKNTPDPDFGEFYRDENGEPTGYLHEFGAYVVIQKVIAEMTNEELTQYVNAFTKAAHKGGVTSVSDVQVGEFMTYDVYDKMNEAGELNIRIHYCPQIQLSTEKMVELKEKHNGDRLRFSGAKTFMDGTAAGHTAIMVEPYLDEPDNVGKPSIDLDYVKEKIVELDALGIRTRVHACGDLSVRLALDDFELARRTNGNMDTRHSIEHVEVATKEDLPRFGILNVIAAVQPNHMPRNDYYDHPFHTVLGAERMKYSWPFNTIRKFGGKLAYGTDNPCVGIHPAASVFRSVNRLSDEMEPEGGFNPVEKVDLQSTLEAYTANAAYINYRENDLGVLKPGYLADIAVLDQNIFKMADEDLKNFQIAATYFDGELVYENTDL